MGSWPLVQELYERGDSAFLAEIRQVHLANRLGAFAETWFADKRPFARQALLDYLSLPFDAPRHEALVKRLFKKAEAAGDDALMGAFLVAFDRLVRQCAAKRYRSVNGNFATAAEADRAAVAWEAQGFENPTRWNQSIRGKSTVYMWATRQEEILVDAFRPFLQPTPQKRAKDAPPSYGELTRYRKKPHRLFTGRTRRYLRRRAWRYFRKLGHDNPQRYVEAAAEFLPRYLDADVADGCDLLDNWGLIHALFYHAPALERPANGCRTRAEAKLDFAPAFVEAWANAPVSLLKLMFAAQARPVRMFALWFLRTHHSSWIGGQPLETWLRCADHDDSDVSEFGFEQLATAELSSVPASDWIRRLDGEDLDKLESWSRLLEAKLDPFAIALAQAVALARHRVRPVARLGLKLLEARTWTANDADALLPLCQADCAAVRPEIAAWLRRTLEGFGPPAELWLLDFLDSKHADVRALGWEWFQKSSFRDEPNSWRKLLESPYDDVRKLIVERLPVALTRAPENSVRWLWATMLCRLHGVGRTKPGVVERIGERLAESPNDADELLPLLALAVRSKRGPEFRAGLAATVRLAEAKPELRARFATLVPELEVS